MDNGDQRKSGMSANRQPRKQVERREQAATRILDAAIRLIGEKGYDRFTLAEVGERAGYSRGLPAHYFGKKEDLLSEVMRYIIENYRKGITKFSDVEPGLPHLIAKIRAYSAGGANPAPRAFSLLVAEAMVRPKLRRTIADINSQGTLSWENEIRVGIKAGNIRADVDVTAVAAMIYSFARGQMAFATHDPKFNVNDTTEEFIATLTQRLAARSDRSALPPASKARPPTIARSR
jgi:AcrR family transcriptional regulator